MERGNMSLVKFFFTSLITLAVCPSRHFSGYQPNNFRADVIQLFEESPQPTNILSSHESRDSIMLIVLSRARLVGINGAMVETMAKLLVELAAVTAGLLHRPAHLCPGLCRVSPSTPTLLLG